MHEEINKYPPEICRLISMHLCMYIHINLNESGTMIFEARIKRDVIMYKKIHYKAIRSLIIKLSFISIHYHQGFLGKYFIQKRETISFILTMSFMSPCGMGVNRCRANEE